MAVVWTESYSPSVLLRSTKWNASLILACDSAELVSFFSTRLRSRWLNARPSDPQRKKPAASRLTRVVSQRDFQLQLVSSGLYFCFVVANFSYFESVKKSEKWKDINPYALLSRVTLSIFSDFLNGKHNLDIFLISGRRASCPYLQFSL